jgi:hypothetical protein
MNVGEDGRVAAVARVPAGEDDSDADAPDASPDASPEDGPDGAAQPVPTDGAPDTPEVDTAGPGDDTAPE